MVSRCQLLALFIIVLFACAFLLRFQRVDLNEKPLVVSTSNGKNPIVVEETAWRQYRWLRVNASLCPKEPLPLMQHVSSEEAILSRMVFAVLTDYMFWESRLVPMLSTWLRDTAHTFIYFTNWTQSHVAAEKLQKAFHFPKNVTIVFLDPPVEGLKHHPNGAWKNFEIMKDLHQRFFSPDASKPILSTKVDWYAIVDDDSYIFASALRYHLTKLQLSHNPSLPIYAGHDVLYCMFCRSVKKRFHFIYGGNGIYMNTATIRRMGRKPILESCITNYKFIAGDERLAKCFKANAILPTNIDGGTESVFISLGDQQWIVNMSHFPFSFHQMKNSTWIEDLWALEGEYRSHLLMRKGTQENGYGRILCWHHIIQRFLMDLKGKYPEWMYYPSQHHPDAILREQYWAAMRKKAGRHGVWSPAAQQT